MPSILNASYDACVYCRAVCACLCLCLCVHFREADGMTRTNKNKQMAFSVFFTLRQHPIVSRSKLAGRLSVPFFLNIVTLNLAPTKITLWKITLWIRVGHLGPVGVCVCVCALPMCHAARKTQLSHHLLSLSVQNASSSLPNTKRYAIVPCQ